MSNVSHHMGPTTYTLCQKAVIGPAMWLASLCVFPPLIPDTPLPLDQAGMTVKHPFVVPVDKRYLWTLIFVFPSIEAGLADKIVGSRFDPRCLSDPASLSGQVEFGRPIPIHIVIRRAKDRVAILDTTFQTLCHFGYVGDKKSRAVGWVELVRGEYIAEVTNLAAQDGLSAVKTTVSLVPGLAK